MSDKSSGVDFDRQVFVQTQAPAPNPGSRVAAVLFVVAVLAAIVFLGYKLLPSASAESASAGDPALAKLDKRLGAIEKRLEKLEAGERTGVPAKKGKLAE